MRSRYLPAKQQQCVKEFSKNAVSVQLQYTFCAVRCISFETAWTFISPLSVFVISAFNVLRIVLIRILQVRCQCGFIYPWWSCRKRFLGLKYQQRAEPTTSYHIPLVYSSVASTTKIANLFLIGELTEQEMVSHKSNLHGDAFKYNMERRKQRRVQKKNFWWYLGRASDHICRPYFKYIFQVFRWLPKADVSRSPMRPPVHLHGV